MNKLEPKKFSHITTNYNASIWPLIILSEMLCFKFQQIIGVNFGAAVGEWKNRTNRWAVEPKAFKKISQKIIYKTQKDKNWMTGKLKKLDELSKELAIFTANLFKNNFKNKTDRELYQLYMHYRKIFIDMYAYGWIPNAVEGFDNLFSEKLKKYLQKKLTRFTKEHLLGEYFAVLTTPAKMTTGEKEQIDFLKLLNKIKKILKNKKFTITPEIDKLFEKHTKKYCWLPFDYEGEPWSKNYFIGTAKSLFKHDIDPDNELKKIKRAKKDLVKKQKQCWQELNLEQDKKYNYLFTIAQELMWWKAQRKYILYKSYYHTDKLIKEIARRLSLTPTQVRHILPQEMEDVLIKRKYSPDLLNERIKHCIIVLADSKINVYIGKKADELSKKFFPKKRINRNIKELTGQTAFSGQAKGLVKIINDVKDMDKMNKGDILVSEKTVPALVPAIKKASAIITDQGGITCHAAIIAREMRKPCIIGTKIATRVLRDGDLVEVDADKELVKKLKKVS